MGSLKRRAIISVWNKEGVEQIAQALVRQGIEILSTGSTATYLQSHGVPVGNVSDYTGQPEVFGGRVKTLHPKVAGGILFRRALEEDLKEAEVHEINPIDFVIVNLYPFEMKRDEYLSKQSPPVDGHAKVFSAEVVESLVEFIDIGGPTMIRSAAKNFASVVVVVDPADYGRIGECLADTGDVPLSLRLELARKVFALTSAYDGAIAQFLSTVMVSPEGAMVAQIGEQPPALLSLLMEKIGTLRYGENPHQWAAQYQRVGGGSDFDSNPGGRWYRLHQGKELSYNNLVDAAAAAELLVDLLSVKTDSEECAVVIKHTNPSGVALASDGLTAFERARAADPVSAFGGVIAISGCVNGEIARSIISQFVEIVVAEQFSEEALQIFATKKAVRLLEVQWTKLHSYIQGADYLTVRTAINSLLVQQGDTQTALPSASYVKTQHESSPVMTADAAVAWVVCKHVKSNAIVVVKDRQTVGVGAGQMSRVDSARLAIHRAADHGFSVEGGVAASDAFLPFPDTLQTLAKAGVKGLVQPGGSIKDNEVIQSAEELGVVMWFMGERHFRH